MAARDSEPHLPLHLARDALRERRGGGDQQRLRVGAVLGLGEQIGGDEVGARVLVGDHHDLGDAGRQVGRGAGGIVRDQQLGGRHPGVAGAEQLVALRYRTRCRRPWRRWLARRPP